MFTVDSTIDSIQNAKKSFVSHMIKDADVAAKINDLVDAETTFTKSMTTTTSRMLQKISNEIIAGAAEINSITKETAEHVSGSDLVRDLQERTTKGFYDTFWRDAMKFYQTGTVPAKTTSA
jgi:hypothetical protein